MRLAGFIASQRTDHGVTHAVTCRLLEVSDSWFYRWRDRAPTARQRRRAELDAKMKKVFDDSHGTYGLPRVHAELVDDGKTVGENTVAASMRRQGLVARQPKRRKGGLTRQDRTKMPFPDLVKRDFTDPAPNLKWVGDFTEIPTEVISAASGHPSDHPCTALRLLVDHTDSPPRPPSSDGCGHRTAWLLGGPPSGIGATKSAHRR